MATVDQQLAILRKQLAAEKARADAAEVSLYDGYMRAILAGLVTKLDWETPPRNIADQAERITLACLRLRTLYKAGLSPNLPPKPGANDVPPKLQGYPK